MILFDDPATAIPLDPLPGLFTRLCDQRGYHDPFKRLFICRRIGLPDSHHPDRQRLCAPTRIIPGWQHGGRAKTQLQRGLSGRSPMTRWHLKRPLVLTWPRPYLIQQMAYLSRCELHAAILGGPDHKVGLGREATAKEGQHIGTAISHMDHQTRTRWCADLFNQLLPDIGFSSLAVAALIALLALGSGDADKRTLRHTSHQGPRLWQNRQHRLQ